MDNTAPTLTARDVPARRLAVPSTASPELQHTRAVAFIPGLAERFPHSVIRRLIAGVTVRAITPATLDPASRL